MIISFHVTPDLYVQFSRRKYRNFFLENAPIGCRDLATKQFFDSIGVPAYFSGCLTLTLQANPSLPRKDLIVAANLNEAELSVVRSKSKSRVLSVDTTVPMLFSMDKRMEMAKAFLSLYQSARCVVTRRLHVALPCLALGVPVLVVALDDKIRINLAGRFSGYESMLNFITAEDLNAGNVAYDFEDPPPNPTAYVRYRNELITRCHGYTGFDSQESFCTIEDPEAYLLDAFTHQSQWTSKCELMKYSRRDLFKAWRRKLLFRGHFDSSLPK